MIREQGIGLNQVCKEMNLVLCAVRRWVDQLDEELAVRPGLAKSLTPEQQRIRDAGGAAQTTQVGQRTVKKSHGLVRSGNQVMHALLTGSADKAVVGTSRPQTSISQLQIRPNKV